MKTDMKSKARYALIPAIAFLAGIVFSSAYEAQSNEKSLKARLGPFLFDRTTVKEASALLGPGSALKEEGPFKGFVWYDPRAGTFLILRYMDSEKRKGLGLPSSKGILRGVLGKESEYSHFADADIRSIAGSLKTLADFEAPGGARIGDNIEVVFKKCGKGQLMGKNGNRESYNWYFKEGYRTKPRGKSEPGFDMQLTFVKGRLVCIYLTEGS